MVTGEHGGVKAIVWLAEVCLAADCGSKVCLFGQWAAANCAAPPIAGAGQYATSSYKPLLFGFPSKWRYINVRTFNLLTFLAKFALVLLKMNDLVLWYGDRCSMGVHVLLSSFESRSLDGDVVQRAVLVDRYLVLEWQRLPLGRFSVAILNILTVGAHCRRLALRPYNKDFRLLLLLLMLLLLMLMMMMGRRREAGGCSYRGAAHLRSDIYHVNQ